MKKIDLGIMVVIVLVVLFKVVLRLVLEVENVASGNKQCLAAVVH